MDRNRPLSIIVFVLLLIPIVSAIDFPGWEYCKNNPCPHGYGDCEPGQCESGTECQPDKGTNYGWPSTVDVCEDPNRVTTETPVSEKPCHTLTDNECLTQNRCELVQGPSVGKICQNKITTKSFLNNIL